MDATKHKCNVDLVGEATTTYIDTGYPANGTKYYWWVWAYNADGTPSLWAEVSANGRSFTSTPTYIAAPTLVSPGNGASVSGNSVTFEWSAVTGATNYRLLVSRSTNILDSSKVKFNDLVGDGTTYIDTGYPAMVPSTTGGCGPTTLKEVPASGPRCRPMGATSPIRRLTWRHRLWSLRPTGPRCLGHQ